MRTLLIRNIRALISCDENDTLYRNVDLYSEDGIIRAIGENLSYNADEIIDATHMLCYPGLINCHHHLYQCFSRNLPEVQNMELFDWLTTLYEIWKNLNGEVVQDIGGGICQVSTTLYNAVIRAEFVHDSIMP